MPAAPSIARHYCTRYNTHHSSPPLPPFPPTHVHPPFFPLPPFSSFHLPPSLTSPPSSNQSSLHLSAAFTTTFWVPRCCEYRAGRDGKGERTGGCCRNRQKPTVLCHGQLRTTGYYRQESGHASRISKFCYQIKPGAAAGVRQARHRIVQKKFDASNEK